MMRTWLVNLALLASTLSGAGAFSSGMIMSSAGSRIHSATMMMRASGGCRDLRRAGLELALAPPTSCRVHIASPSVMKPTFVELVGGSGGGGKGIVRGGGEGGGGGGGGDNEDEKAQIAALLSKYGLAASQLPKGAEALGADKLGRFLEAYKNSLNKWLIDVWPAWRDKMLADPEFAYKLMVEETVGLGLAMSGTVAARGKDLLKEMDFFLTDCAVGAVINFVIIWLLAPSVTKTAAASGLSATISRLPAFVLAEGKYTVAQRVGAGVYKGSLFSACGFMGSVGGTTLAYLLFQARKLFNAEGSTKGGELPNVVANSLGWASFMFASTNPRYQLINGVEQVMYKVLPTSISKTGSLVLRTGNNVVGGMTWVAWARFIGLQKQAEKEAPMKSKKK